MKSVRYSSYKRRKYPLYISLGIGVIAAVYVVAVLMWPLRAITPVALDYTKTIPAATKPAWPTQYAALGTTSQGVLATTSEAPVPIASITKLFTALIVLEAKPLKQGEIGPTITFTSADVARYNQYIAGDGSVGPVKSGMQISEYQLLQGMLLGSANNYADAAAIWAYGSIDNYLAAARDYLRANGFENTTLADATGFSANSKSTPRELVKLGAIAMQNPITSGLVSQKSAVIPGVGNFTNTNKLLGTDGIVGLKTGTTDEAGSCLLFASQFTADGKPVTLVGVVLGAPDHPTLFQDVATLTQQTTGQFKNREIVPGNTVFAHYKTPWGATAQSASPSITQLTWTGANATLRAQHNNIKPDANKKSGRLSVTIGSQTTTHDLALNKPLQGPSMWWRITHPGYIFDI